MAKLQELMQRIRDARGTVFLFTLLFIAVAAVGLPITPMILMGGALFGVWRGVALNWVAALTGAFLCYHLSRALGKNAFRRIIERMARRRANFSGEKARRTLLRLRLIPLSPFGALNFAAGLSEMRIRDFLIATGIGILPSLTVYTYFASQVLGGGAKARNQAIVHTAIAAGVLLLMSFAPALWDKLHGSEDEADAASEKVQP